MSWQQVVGACVIAACVVELLILYRLAVPDYRASRDTTKIRQVGAWFAISGIVFGIVAIVG